MFFLSATLMSVAAGFIPVAPALALFHFAARKKGGARGVTAAHRIAVYVFCLYLLAVFSMTGMPAIYHLSAAGHGSINLIPFANIASLQYKLNILFFVPLGALLPALWQRFAKFRSAFFCGFALSLAVETMQLFTPRATDIDDLITNAAGTAVGYALFALARRWRPQVSVFAAAPDGCWRWEPLLCFLAALASTLAVQTLVTRGLWGVMLR